MAVERRRTHFILGLLAPILNNLKRVLIGLAGNAGGGAVTGSSAAGSAHSHAISGNTAAGSGHTHTFTGTQPAGAVVEAAAGTGVTTVGQDVTTTENFNATPNQYANHWLIVEGEAPALIASHPGAAAAPLVLTIFGLAPPTSGAAFKILRAPTPAGANANEDQHTHGAGTIAAANESAHTHGAGTYEAPAGSAPAFVHTSADERTVSTANASSLDTSVALCKALLAAYNAHRTDLLHHQGADTTNTVASAVSDIVDLPSAITAANQLKAAYNAHRGQGGVHWTNDSANAVAALNATDQNSLNTLLNEMKGDINAHFGADALDDFESWRLAAV